MQLIDDLMKIGELMKQLLSLKNFYQFATNCQPWLLFSVLILFFVGMIAGIYFAPADYQQGEGYRIIYVHVPSAFWSLGIYTIVFLNSVIFLVWRIKLADIVASCSAPIGATYTFIALVTGAIWGKPMWGTWWVWDARLTSELILLFLYLGYMGLRNATEDISVRGKLAGVLAVIGMINVPIVHFSVQWWHTLHQGPTLLTFNKPTMPLTMLAPLILMLAAFAVFYVTVLCIRMRAEILEREMDAEWVMQSEKLQSEKLQSEKSQTEKTHNEISPIEKLQSEKLSLI